MTLERAVSGAGKADEDFPRGGGELGELIRNFDWSVTSLGSIAQWPPSLRTATDIVLHSPLPLVMLWGPEGVMIYNDAYSVFAGQRHPRLLGSRVLEGWPEVADFNAHVMRVGLAGGTLSFKNQQLTLYRNNVAEQVWMDLNYGPVLDEQGKPAGVLAIVVETTGQVKAERALAAERAAVDEANRRLSAESKFLHELFEQAPSFMAMVSGPQHVFRLANAGYLQLIGRRDVIGLALREAVPEVVDQGFAKLLDHVFETGEPFIGKGMKASLRRDQGEAMEDRFIDFVYQPVRDTDGRISGIFVEGQDVTERLKSERHLRLVVNELNHRVKNTLSMIQAIAAQTFRSADDLPGAQKSFSARIVALAKANDLLTGENWEGAALSDIVARSSEATGSHRFVIEGPPVRLSPKTAISLSMAIHELTTNAVKYGALSNGTGRVLVNWSVKPDTEGERLHLEWREEGGPPVAAPSRRGFGSRLVERGLSTELGGEVAINFNPQGILCVVDAPLQRYGAPGGA